jgi:hypothetical protein
LKPRLFHGDNNLSIPTRPIQNSGLESDLTPELFAVIPGLFTDSWQSVRFPTPSMANKRDIGSRTIRACVCRPIRLSAVRHFATTLNPMSMTPFLRPIAMLVFPAVLLLSACVPAHNVPPPPGPRDLPRTISPAKSADTYTRCYQTAPDTYQLQTGYRVFRPVSGNGPTIELLGAAHIGAANYYAAIQQRLDRADLVLFEAVYDEKNPVESISEAEQAEHEAASTYHKLARILGLVSQKSALQYERKHFERCDMSIQQMKALLDAEIAKGGPGADEAKKALSDFRSLLGMIRGDSILINLALWLADKNAFIKAKVRLMLVTSTPAGKDVDHLPPRIAKLINEDRNQHVLRELPGRLAKHPRAKHVVIFYGSAHLPGLARGLAKQGYQPAAPIQWLTVTQAHPIAEGLSYPEVYQTIEDARAGK